ncbi:multicopper oxidase domain-containing protein [Halovenus marina]|uniref:multicopper oxidase domain-containing protein n=1 Tax=Halovenus marina TaxID=3396621 RepID=UPI003F546C9A
MSRVTYDRAKSVTESLESRLTERIDVDAPVSRRAMLGALGVAGSAAVGLSSGVTAQQGHGDDDENDAHGNFGTTGEYEDGFDPHEFLRTFNTGESGQDDLEQEIYEENGETVRHFQFTVVDTTVEIAPGVEFPVWAFESQVPGPTIRAVEGDIIRITLINGSRHGHTIHPHFKNIVPEMDGIPQNGPGVIESGGEFTYEWRAQPAGVHFYHCHALPLKEHIHRGMYGMFVVDPDPERVRENPREYINYQGPIPDEYRDELVAEASQRNHTTAENDEVDELVMVMNSFDTNFDGENEVYAANTRAFAYGAGETDENGNLSGTKRPIQIDKNQRQLVYLLNVTEFDPINSFHTHSQFFDYYDHGTTLQPTHKTIDTVMQCQAQRGIIDLDYSDHEPGLYMFHAHQSEFAELGWMSFFEVV